MAYQPAGDRYQVVPYRRSGRTGLKLPAVSLGLWQNFGSARPLRESREILLRAFDQGITHFDLANNYGPPTARRRRPSAGFWPPTSIPSAMSS